MSTFIPLDIHVERRETKEGKRKKSRSKKLTAKEITSCTISHESVFKVTWDWFVLALVLYTAIEIPFSNAFLGNTKQSKSIWEELSSGQPREIANVIVDVMFIIDIAINFRTTFVEGKSGSVISEPKKIAIHYFKTWFVVDFVAAIPFDFFIPTGAEGVQKLASPAGLLKTARLLRLIRVSRKMDRYSEFGLAVIFLLTSFFTLIAHWLACLWNVIGEREIDVPYGWIQLLANAIDQPVVNRSLSDSGPGVSTRYITALYFTITSLTSIGFGNVAPTTDNEKIFSVLMMLVGALFYAVIFGNLTAIIQRLYSRTARYHQDVRIVNECIALHKIPESLQKTLRDFFTTEQAATRGDDIESIMHHFPESLQAEIRLHLNQDLFEQFDIFDGLSDGCLRALAAAFRAEVFPNQLHLLKEGDLITKLYFIVYGSVEVLQVKENTMCLGPGDVVGCHIASRKRRLGHCVKSQVSLLAKVRTQVHLITLSDLMEIMRVYPEMRERIMEQMELSCDLASGKMNCKMVSRENNQHDQQEHIELLSMDNHDDHVIINSRRPKIGICGEDPKIRENHNISDRESDGELFTTDKQRMENLEAKLSRVEEVLEEILRSLEKTNLLTGKSQSANSLFHRTSDV